MNARLLTLALALLAAAQGATAGPDPALGASVRRDIAAQTINMDPHYVGEMQPGDNAARAVDAFVRYRTDRLKPLLKTNGKPELGSQGGAQDTPTTEIPLLGPPAGGPHS